MHELGIAQEIVEQVSARAQGARVLRVVLEIGKLAAILPDALRFCFDLAARRHPWKAPPSTSSRPPAGRAAAPAAETSCSTAPSAAARAAAPTSSGSRAKNSSSKNSRWPMCETCGCSDQSRPRVTDLETGATIALDEDHDHQHRQPSRTTTITTTHHHAPRAPSRPRSMGHDRGRRSRSRRRSSPGTTGWRSGTAAGSPGAKSWR